MKTVAFLLFLSAVLPLLAADSGPPTSVSPTRNVAIVFPRPPDLAASAPVSAPSVTVNLTPKPVEHQPLDEDTAFASLLRWEGWRLDPYRDGTSWCVGAGHNLTAHAQPRRRYSDEECRALFRADYREAMITLRAAIDDFDGLPLEVRKVALNVMWSVGPTGFMRWRELCLSLSTRAYNASASVLFASRWYRQVQRNRGEWAVQTLKHAP